ncbi:hypothetical protein GCM10010964_22120 [Caldovatus sediminis]|uniref:Uncharacterized protein n=1 Tax=Caldovatus sediminis TaxID=2041189 RepID=A0A8J3EDT8_9PROT|nr:cupin domain-containing protein [Caldovatus sediminis]GGG33762.1 hypothetical protein GCM10010964_22120 [Caldovatus sediminis]
MPEAAADPRFAFAAAALAPPGPGRCGARLLGRGALEARRYAPRGRHPQGPHGRDAVPVGVSGPGDLLFAPAGAGHRFGDFPDLAARVILRGPEGGEAPR